MSTKTQKTILLLSLILGLMFVNQAYADGLATKLKGKIKLSFL